MPTDRVQCLQIGCNAYRSGARPPPQAHMRTCPKGRPRTRQAWLGPAATNPQQLTAPAATHPQQPTAPGNEPQTANRARGRQGLTGLRDDEPSGRLAAQTTSGPPSARLAALRGIKPGHGAHIQRVRTRSTHTPRPGAGHTYDEAGASRAQQHDRAPAS